MTAWRGCTSQEVFICGCAVASVWLCDECVLWWVIGKKRKKEKGRKRGVLCGIRDRRPLREWIMGARTDNRKKLY
jgi:hypothetical protein